MILMFEFWFLRLSHFGGVLGAQMEAKSEKKWFPKVIEKQVEQIQIFINFGVPLGSKMEPERRK